MSLAFLALCEEFCGAQTQQELSVRFKARQTVLVFIDLTLELQYLLIQLLDLLFLFRLLLLKLFLLILLLLPGKLVLGNVLVKI